MSSDVPHTRNSYLDAPYGLAAWLLTKDHKRIAMLYLISITIFFAVGGMFADRHPARAADAEGRPVDGRHLQQALHAARRGDDLLLPDPVDSGDARQLPAADHDRREGSRVPAHQPDQLVHLRRRRDRHAGGRVQRRARHRLDVLHAVQLGRVADGGSTAAIGVFITGFSSILTGLNFIVTVHRMRAPGMTWFRLPLFVWAQYATSLVMILGTPVIAITVLLVFAERTLHLGFFDPTRGGDPVLFQHLFWFYSHPAVYIMILPGMGVMSELVAGGVAQAGVRLQLRRVLESGHRHPRLPRLGPSPLREQPVDLRGPRVLDHHDARRRAVGGEDLQLDRDDVQGLGDVGVADLLGPRLHGPVHDRRADRPVPRRDGPGHPPDRHATSSSRTSTTSWSAARSWPTWAACTSGGRR